MPDNPSNTDNGQVLKSDDWDGLEIQRAAAQSGRPLEVRCAMAFLKARAASTRYDRPEAGWQVRMGPYYTDTELKPPRELDLLVEQRVNMATNGGYRAAVKLRLLVSCKGFPPDQCPMTYRTGPGSVATLEPWDCDCSPLGPH